MAENENEPQVNDAEVNDAPPADAEVETSEEQVEQEGHVVANDGTNWTTPPSPVSLEEKIAADKAEFNPDEGEGPTGTNGR